MTYDINEDINEIKKNLNDPQVWLMYADVLQSKGDPIGELIAINHNLNILPSLPEGQDAYSLMRARDNVRKILEEQLKEKGISGILRWDHGYPREVYFEGTSEQRVLLREEYPLIQPIETIRGDYRVFSKLVPGTRRHVDELWKNRFAVPKSKNYMFWTTDGAIYFMGDDKPYLAFTRENQNPLFKNLDVAYKQLLNTRNYRVPDKDLESALADKATEVFDLDELNLNCYSNEYVYLNLFTTDPKLYSLDGDDRRLVERIYGKGDDFNTRRVYVLNPSYVREHASAGAIGWASWLYGFDFNSCFYAGRPGVNNHYALRGVVASEPAGES